MDEARRPTRLKSARAGLHSGRRAREERGAGGVVLRRIRGTIHALLIRDSYGNWGLPKGHLEPGEAATLTVTYDPQAHGGQTGKFMRVVYIRSSDPETPEATLTIRVTVTEP